MRLSNFNNHGQTNAGVGMLCALILGMNILVQNTFGIIVTSVALMINVVFFAYVCKINKLYDEELPNATRSSEK